MVRTTALILTLFGTSAAFGQSSTDCYRVGLNLHCDTAQQRPSRQPMDYLSGLGGLQSLPNAQRDFDAGVASAQALRQQELDNRQRELAIQQQEMDLQRQRQNARQTDAAAQIKAAPSYQEISKSDPVLADVTLLVTMGHCSEAIAAAVKSDRMALAKRASDICKPIE